MKKKWFMDEHFTKNILEPSITKKDEKWIEVKSLQLEILRWKTLYKEKCKTVQELQRIIDKDLSKLWTIVEVQNGKSIKEIKIGMK